MICNSRSARKITTPRTRPLTGLVQLEDRSVPATAFALSGSNLLRFDTDNPAAALAPVAVTGVAAGETLVGMDVRPQNGQLYALASDGAGKVHLYAVSSRTAWSSGRASSVPPRAPTRARNSTARKRLRSLAATRLVPPNSGGV